MKTSKLAKRKKNYSLVQVVHHIKLFVLLSSFLRHMTVNTVIYNRTRLRSGKWRAGAMSVPLSALRSFLSFYNR